MKQYFLKEIVENVFCDSTGKPFPFESLDKGFGVLELDDSDPSQANLIVQLNAHHNAHIGGIMPITEDEYRAKKTEFPYQGSGQRSEPPLRVLRPTRLPSPVVESAAAGKPILPDGNGAPILPKTAPPPATPIIQPRRGKIPRNAAEQAALLTKSESGTPVLVAPVIPLEASPPEMVI